MQSPRRLKSVQPKQQNILVTYDPSLQPLILTVYSQISKQYASVYIITDPTQKQKYSEQRKSLLTKRAVKYIYLQKFTPELSKNKNYNPNNFSVWLHYCDTSCLRQELEDLFPTMEVVELGDKEDFNSLFAKATKLMHLDFIWLGAAGRLGFSVNEFQMSVKEFQNFQAERITFIEEFLEVLSAELSPEPDQSLDLNPQLLPTILKQLFQKCTSQLTQKLTSIQSSISTLICQSYNDHILVCSPTYHSYYKLLKSRNYFKLIWIEEPVIKRYRNFRNFLKGDARFVRLQEWVGDVENFLLLDDYVYENFLQRVAFDADFVVNTGIVKHGYREIIEKNYKEVFRKFRPDFDEYFISLCKILKTRGGCIKQAVGSIIVKNKRILSTGYNGTPMGSINCYNGGCRVCNDSNELSTIVLSCNCIHAEYSCIMQAGIESTPGCTLYTTQLPCLWCAKVICQAKIKAVVYLRNDCKLLEYKNQERVFQIFGIAGIEVREFMNRERRFSKIL